jgi:hypothetical protein
MENICINAKNNGFNVKRNIHSLFEVEYLIINFIKTSINALRALLETSFLRMQNT